MRVAHLLITYTNPLQTERMIRRMQHPDFDFYIHVDKKVDIRPHLFLAKIPQVYLIQKRTDVIWAGYNTIKATLRSVQEILATGRQYDYVHLMSGQDYPIKTASYILDFFHSHKGKEFMQFKHFDQWPIESYPRIKKYHLTNYRWFPGRYRVQKLLNRFLPPRKSPFKMDFFGSSMFWALTPACLKYVLDLLKNNPRLERFMHFSWAPDEFLFQTLVLNSPFKNNVLNDNLLYLDWEIGTAHPKVMTAAHLGPLIDSDKLFARKFNLTVDAVIMDKVDDYLTVCESENMVAAGKAAAVVAL
jgi:hypothetical protein